MTSPIERPIRTTLNRIEKASLLLLLLVAIAFGGVTLMRSAYLSYRHTDADVYFRAAWAMQHKENIYRATDDNGWHYHYPPTLATLLIPLSDPPHDKANESGWRTSYPLAIAIWYALGFVAFCFGMHLLAGSLERIAPRAPFHNPQRFSRVWWALRVVPFVIGIEPVGASLGRGQVTPFVFMFICAMISEWTRGRSARAGLWLAAAASIKVFPVFLLVAPLYRRDWAFLMGFAAGLLLGLVMVPALAIGFPATFDLLSTYWDVFMQELIRRAEGVRTRELFNDAEGDLMSFKAILLRTYLFFNGDGDRPAPQLLSAVHVAIAGVVTLVTLWAARSFSDAKSAFNPLLLVLLVGSLITVALPMVPTAQPHYFMLSIVLVTALMSAQWQRTGALELSPNTIVLFVAFCVLSSLSEIPGFEEMMTLGAPVYAGLFLWVCGIIEIRRQSKIIGTHGRSGRRVRRPSCRAASQGSVIRPR